MTYSRYYIVLILMSAFWFIVDVWTKHWAKSTENLPWGDPEGFFYLSQITHNSGIAFGLPLPNWIQIAATVLIFVFLIYTAHQWLEKNKKWLLQALTLGLVLGGALGNFWERVNVGYVVDFIVLGPIPNFNLADVGVTMGLLALILLGWSLEKTSNLKSE